MNRLADSSKSLEMNFPMGRVSIQGTLVLPDKASGLILFAHGSGSSRFSPRNRHVAERLHREGLATLLADLLTPEEDENYDNRFDISLLSDRLVDLTRAVRQLPETQHLPLGYFGASTGAASALNASAVLQSEIKAVVSRGGRPDLSTKLDQVKAPVLLIVGSLDQDVLSLNRAAMQQLKSLKHLSIVEGATHLFEEPGTLDEVAELAAEWFRKYVIPSSENKAHV